MEYGDRRVYTVSAFLRGVASYLTRLPTLWVEGEVTELRRQRGWANVFFTLRDPENGTCVAVSMPRVGFDALRVEIGNGSRVHVWGRPELWAGRGQFQLRALTLEPVGLGDVLLRIERLRQKLAAEGLFDPARKRPLPRVPRRIGLVTGSEAAAKGDVLAALRQRFPPARVLVAETTVQGARAPLAIAAALRAVCRAGVDVVVLARGGGSFDDLLPFSDERLVRAVAACPVPVVSAVGHEQDTPLCDFAADVRASTPTAAARLVVPDARELLASLDGLRAGLRGAVLTRVERAGDDLARDRLRLLRAPALLLERKRVALADSRRRLRDGSRLLLERRRGAVEALAGRLHAVDPRATLLRGYAIVRTEGRIVRTTRGVPVGAPLDVELAEGSLAARVEEVRE
jgi:exodeoxyribonuclease VII large subunit